MIGDIDMAPEHRRIIYDLVETERLRQNRLKAEGRFAYTLADPEMSHGDRVACLGEEFGEACRAVVEVSGLSNDLKVGDLTMNLQKELVQVAACCVAWLEAIRG